MRIALGRALAVALVVGAAAYTLGSAGAGSTTSVGTLLQASPLAPNGLIRVGIATDLSVFELPCCEQGAALVLADGKQSLHAALRATPRNVESSMSLRLQAAALKDELQASNLAVRLERLTGETADSLFDATTGLYRVRVGRFQDRRLAEDLRTRFAGRGLSDAWIAREGELLGEPAFSVEIGSSKRQIDGRWLEIAAAEGGSLRFGGKRYRGSLLLYLNDRGSLNLVNQIPIEDYLRGVVPLEMGPEIYGHPEALKAQAVASRTYTIRHLGEFLDEGFDICATPRCQAYGGAGVEHAAADRAVAATAGEVLTAGGRLVNALYSATCGGFTEDVRVVFPAMEESCLRGVPCAEGPSRSLAGAQEDGTPLARGAMRTLLPPSQSSVTVHDLEDRLVGLGELASIPLPRDRLRSLRRREVKRFVASLFDLRLDPSLLRDRVRGDMAVKWSEAEVALRRELVDRRAREELSSVEVETLLFGLARILGVVRQQRGYFMALGVGEIDLRFDSGRRTIALPGDFGAYLRDGERFEAAPLSLAAGDRLDLLWQDERLLAVVHDKIPAAGLAAVSEPPWTRVRSHPQLRRSVAERYPGFDLRDFEVVSRGVSGRVGQLRLNSVSGESFILEGLAVRWTLDLPDTLFTAEPRTVGGDGWVFHGRGRGHGVGMCQVGAYTMALRGNSYREILSHYYSGIELAQLPQATSRAL